MIHMFVRGNEEVQILTQSQDPIIFRGLKSLTFRDTQQSSLLRLAAEGISVRNSNMTVVGSVLKFG